MPPRPSGNRDADDPGRYQRWHDANWSGPFYSSDPPTDEWLRFYSTRFSTVELNNSFYRLPSFETFGAWREQVPNGFIVAVKASRYLTHVRRLLEPKEPVERLWSNARGLGSRLGPVLFQLPPTLTADLDRLRELLGALSPAMRLAFEFRHRSWFRDDVFAALARADAFAYFNNDQQAAAPRDAGRLVRLLDERGAEVAMPTGAVSTARTTWA